LPWSLGKAPTLLTPQDLDAPFIGSFLNHLEQDRDNGAASRNIRLAAVHSFFRYVALQEPSLGALAQRVPAIPCKRRRTKPIDFLTRSEIEPSKGFDKFGGR
jgi:integrase